MKNKFLLVLLALLIGVTALIVLSMRQTAHQVVTVEEILDGKTPHQRLRLGARISRPIKLLSNRVLPLVSFSVQGISSNSKELEVRYEGIVPETLQVNREVILEGSYDGELFLAKTLLTKCPSKYVPPMSDGPKQKP